MTQDIFTNSSGMSSHAFSAMARRSREQKVSSVSFAFLAGSTRWLEVYAKLAAPTSLLFTVLNMLSSWGTCSNPSPAGRLKAAAISGGTDPGNGGSKSSSGFPSKSPQYPLWPPGCFGIWMTADKKSTPVAVTSTCLANLNMNKPPEGPPSKRDRQGPTSNSIAGLMFKTASLCKAGSHCALRDPLTHSELKSALPSTSKDERI
mmetsp:Transcript_71691/g.201106  ORF Transcript_71691/g.201106 Transcript_71691/m.201106 type:complete len:204 (-) Transcript_71691:751-1362(-)